MELNNDCNTSRGGCVQCACAQRIWCLCVYDICVQRKKKNKNKNTKHKSHLFIFWKSIYNFDISTNVSLLVDVRFGPYTNVPLMQFSINTLTAIIHYYLMHLARTEKKTHTKKYEFAHVSHSTGYVCWSDFCTNFRIFEFEFSSNIRFHIHHSWSLRLFCVTVVLWYASARDFRYKLRIPCDTLYKCASEPLCVARNNKYESGKKCQRTEHCNTFPSMQLVIGLFLLHAYTLFLSFARSQLSFW